MSRATKAKNAQARATIAARLFLKTKGSLGRNLDDCFEMHDGANVLAHLLVRAANNYDLRRAMHRHGFKGWSALAEQVGYWLNPPTVRCLQDVADWLDSSGTLRAAGLMEARTP